MSHARLTAARRPLFGTTLLLIAASLWGVGFYAQRLSVAVLPPLTSTALRFVLALPVAVATLIVRQRARCPPPWREGALLGGLLYLVFALQAVALRHTSVTRVALIAGLSVVVTPLLQPLFGLGRPAMLQAIAAGFACLGVALLCGVVGDLASLATPPNVGDVSMLLAMLVASLAVLSVARLAPRHDPLALGAVQIVAMTALSLVIAPAFEGRQTLSTLPASTWLSLVYLALFSTIGAFGLQLIGQRHVSPTAAAMVLLLETPIGVVAALVMLGEAMAGWQWLGALFAFGAVVLAVLVEARRSSVAPLPAHAR